MLPGFALILIVAASLNLGSKQIVNASEDAISNKDGDVDIIPEIVLEKPPGAEEFTVQERGPYNLVLTWKGPEDWNHEKTGFEITKIGSPKYLAEILDRKTLLFNATGLVPGTKYTFILKTYNAYRKDIMVTSDPVYLVAWTTPTAPSAPTKLRAVTVTPSIVTVQWDEPQDPNGPVSGYELNCYTANGSRLIHGVTEKMAFTFINLNYGSQFNITVAAFNTIEEDGHPVNLLGPITSLQVKTNTSTPAAPTDLKVVNTTSNSLFLTWKKPAEHLGPVTGYVVTHTNVKSSPTDVVVDITQVEISNLKPWSYYTIQVYAYVDLKDGKVLDGPKVTMIGRTDIAQPSVPVFKAFEEITANSMKAVWTAPVFPNGPVSGYRISYKNGKQSVDTATNGTEYTFKELNPWTEYVFNIAAYNQEEERVLRGDYIVITGRTRSASPEAPGQLTITKLTTTNVIFAWKKPLKSNGPVSGYKVSCISEDDERKGVIIGTKYQFYGLKPWTLYNVSVQAYNMEKVNGDIRELLGPALTKEVITKPTAPSEPTSLTVVEVTNATAEFKWRRPAWPSVLQLPVSGYNVTLVVGNGTILEDDVTDTSYLFSGLFPWSNYTVTVKAYINVTGDEPELILGSNATIDFQTDVTAPNQPNNLTISGVTDTVAVISWSEPDDPLYPQPGVSGYTLTVMMGDVGVQAYLADTRTLEAHDLVPWTEYRVALSAYINITDMVSGGNVSATFRTLPTAPSVPNSLAHGEVTNTSIEVTWQKPIESNATENQPPITGFKVTLAADSGVSTYEAGVNETDHTFSDLKPWTNYNVSVAALINITENVIVGEIASMVVKTTPSAPPPTSKGLVLTSAQEHTANFQIPFDLFSAENGAIEKYYLRVAAIKLQSNASSIGYDMDTDFNSWKETKDGNEWYQSSPKDWKFNSDNPVCSGNDTTGWTCEVGKQKCQDEIKYCNGPLRPDTDYSMTVRAYTAVGWAETSPLEFSTKKTTGGGSATSLPSRGVLMVMIFCVLVGTVPK